MSTIELVILIFSICVGVLYLPFGYQTYRFSKIFSKTYIVYPTIFSYASTLLFMIITIDIPFSTFTFIYYSSHYIRVISKVFDLILWNALILTIFGNYCMRFYNAISYVVHAQRRWEANINSQARMCFQ